MIGHFWPEVEKETRKYYSRRPKFFEFFLYTYADSSVKKKWSNHSFPGVIGDFMICGGPFMFFFSYRNLERFICVQIAKDVSLFPKLPQNNDDTGKFYVDHLLVCYSW